ncbi:hypothetical protein K501DRAFT_191764 [Backusella circina FSU 941]|nr:hypothetical protein K501DRAFT_191764 [Backusella circina FSU 941]
MYKNHDQTFTADHFLQVDQNSTIQKVQVCLPTTAIIAPYLSSNKNHLFIGYQLTFVLFANDVLKYAGYSKFCRRYCPLPSPTDLPALNIDSTYLYSFFFFRARDTSITLFDFEGFPIVSELEARTRKDAVFHAFFDLVQIRKVFSAHKLEFNHYITIVPGLQSVRLLGKKKSCSSSRISQST